MVIGDGEASFLLVGLGRGIHHGRRGAGPSVEARGFPSSEQGRENTHIRAGGEKQLHTAAPEEQEHARLSHAPPDPFHLPAAAPSGMAVRGCVRARRLSLFPHTAAIRPSPSHSPLSPSPLSPSSFTDHPRQPEALPERPDWQARRGQAEVGYGVQRCEQDGENKGDRSGPDSTAHSHFPLTRAPSHTLSLSPQATWSPWTRT